MNKTYIKKIDASLNDINNNIGMLTTSGDDIIDVFETKYNNETGSGYSYTDSTIGIYNGAGDGTEEGSYKYISNDIKELKTYLGIEIENDPDLLDDLEKMDASYNLNKETINEYDKKRRKLKKKLVVYNNIIGRLSDAKTNKHYLLFIIWLVILFIILITVFLNVVEEKGSMNLLSKAILCIFLIIIIYYFIKNTMLYFNGYR